MALQHSKSIEIYGDYVDDFKISPFESVYMLHLRGGLEKAINELTNDEKIKLIHYDLKLIENAKRMSKHLSVIYDFSTSNEPLKEWWWHLDQVADGKISFELKAEVKDG
ncbi:hypothetical protein [Virgibacillus sp. SK37]|uniref:hypothetical protein n=1 Tax=Virgibacillus sp. SK37 TaxID=403957 RepID=UPI0004D154FB|nr:hypothetical protein [Virgibacillus sp. SK37]AIF45086.1 hypothetical protein X953_01390 [Virgibacillus sp. SK37]